MNIYTFILLLSFASCFNYQIEAALQEVSKRSENEQLLEEWFKAAATGKLEVIQELAAKVDVNSTDDEGLTALSNAAKFNQKDIVKFLLKIPEINVNAQDENGFSALLWATCCNFQEIMKLLMVVPGININAENGYVGTVLKWAEQNKRRQAVKLIKDKIEELTIRASEAIKQSNIETLKSIVAQIGVDGITAFEGNTLLDMAFKVHNQDMILFLLNKSENPQELLSRFPFEAISPSSAVFELCMRLAGLEKCVDTSEESEKKDLEVLKICANCSKSDCAKKCSRCKTTYYCSAECQKEHWASHKPSCRPA